MQSKIKLLVTARDPASANDIAQVLPYLINSERFIVKVLAQGSAYSILLDGKTGSNVFEIDFIPSIGDISHEHIENILNEVFLTFQPDSLLTGISGPDYGVDEISLNICSRYRSVKSFSIQSYWGDINKSCGALADTIFVLDEFACKVTTKRNSDCKTVITGSLQSNRYDNFDVKSERSAFRLEYGVKDDALIIALFGQPLFEYEWYRTTLDLFIQSVNKSIQHARIIYKPHPKETDESINWVSEKLSLSAIEFSVIQDINTLTLLAGTDVTVSLFSTVGYDLQNLLYRSKKSFSIPVYLFFDKDCVTWFQENCCLDEIPLSKNDMSVLITDKKKVSYFISEAMTRQQRDKCSHNIKFFLKNLSKNPEDIVMQRILEELV
jgi:hypothetical protein